MRNGRFALHVATMAIGAMLPLSSAWSEVPGQKSHDHPVATDKKNQERDSRLKRKQVRMHRKDQEMDRLMNRRKTR